ncbi:hypothetical protein [Armatimonas rosea]|uniref:Uncharacterized protein n=1 Tax=Armatimonas rosea TaxID=685828 RepID=A0A7W9W760_ARMRO|nr:hypothetical protein [Armatimonas rosea]MBB6050760.1 hypothetical protein [Armatimonas rosea]
MSKPLSELVVLRRRFLRSVSLERDARSRTGLDGYIPTATALTARARIEAGLADPSSRAVSITGAYGTGKSAFALYLVHQLCLAPHGEKSEGLLPVLVTGGREPLIPALYRALEAAVSGQPSLEAPSLTARELAEQFGSKAKEAKKRIPGCQGLLVVVDELGKFLEFAADHPNESDPLALQELAELATRSEVPILVVTVLHQAFDEYAQSLGTVRRAEWQKVQGRFLDIPFGDGAEETVRLIGEAFEGEVPKAKPRAKRQVKAARALNIVPRSLDTDDEATAVFLGASALHPLTLLALPHVFKRFGQSERTLFSFLNSDEPQGFGAFLRNHGPEAQFRLDAVYDYVFATLASTIYSMPGYSKLWSQIQEAVSRCEGRGDLLEARIVKTVGVLHLLGDSARLPASAGVIAFALEEIASVDEVTAALERLTRATILTFRVFKNAYLPYEGSDIDVDERLGVARAALGNIASPASVVAKRIALSPVIARRHSYVYGVLRFFEMQLCTPEELSKAITKEPAHADGKLVLCLATEKAQQETSVALAQSLTTERPHVVVAACLVGETLNEAALAVEALAWVQDNTPELSQDSIAKREVAERHREAMQALEAHWEGLLTPESSTVFVWVGEPRTGDLQPLLSNAFDAAFHLSPIIRNELLNRRNLSSTAAAARRNLIEAMIVRSDQENLGITGFPAERMMYDTLLKATGLHGLHRASGEYDFLTTKPTDLTIRPTLKAIEDYLLGGDLTPKPVIGLYSLLQKRPYGLTEGVAPLLMILALLRWEDEILLYRASELIPQFDAPTAEWLLRRPQDYTVLGIRMSGERQAVVQRFARTLLRPKEGHTLVNITRRLYGWYRRLPHYTRVTLRLSARAKALRENFKEAKNPEQLFFVEMPRSLGVRPFTASSDDENVETFFAAWGEVNTEITGAYDALLKRLEKNLLDAFEESEVDDVRQRARALEGRVLERRLIGFVTRLSEPSLEGNAWIESVASAVVERDPELWGDDEETIFYQNLPQLLSGFHDAEDMAYSMDQAQRDGDDEERVALRISVAEMGKVETPARVLLLTRHKSGEAEQAVAQIREQAKDVLSKLQPKVRAAAVAYLMRELLQETEVSK